LPSFVQQQTAPERTPSGPGRGRMTTAGAVQGEPSMLRLQHAAGNHAVQRVMQRKLSINRPGDRYEQEADRIASQVMAMPAHARGSAPVQVQRLLGGTSGEVAVAPPSVDRVLTSPSIALEPGLRQDMEQRFGADFGAVRVHSGPAAAQSAQEVNAHAYTVGQDVVFAAGRFAPGSGEGRRLLAHELTHVVQQTGVGAARDGRDNRIKSRMLSRRGITEGSDAAVRLTIGIDVSLAFAAAAWTQTEHGPLDDSGLAALRKAALNSDETIDDNERIFIAALLDAANVQRFRAKGHLSTFQEISFPVASVTAANRARVRDFGRVLPPASSSARSSDPLAALDQQIVSIVGSFAGVARDALAIADQAKVRHEAIFFAMLNAASDSTEGDRAFAGAVYAIARQERLPVAADLAAGRVKVDQVPRSSLPENAQGMYMPVAGASGRKGDTMYLPSDMTFLTLEGQGIVVHELTHVSQDAEAESNEPVPVVDAEMPAFLAEAGFYLDAIAERTGPARDRAVEEIAKAVRLTSLLSAIYVATEVLENHSALAALRELHAKVLVVGDPRTALALPERAFNAYLQGLADEDQHWETQQRLTKRLRKAIASDYVIASPTRDDKFRGESILDSPGGASPSPRLQRKPAGQDPSATTTDEIEFIVGGDISVKFAMKAKQLAARGLTSAEELELHALALKGDDTVSDAERLFIVALADPANAKRVAEAKLNEETDVVKLAFPRDAATRARVRHVADLRRPTPSSAVTSTRRELLAAIPTFDAAKVSAAVTKVERAAEEQIMRLTSSRRDSARKVLAFGRANGISADAILDAMINASSDSTEGDMVAAGAVFVIAAAAKHALTSAVRYGEIKVDERAKLKSGVEGLGAAALYRPAASDLRLDHGPRLLKGDTMYLLSSFDVTHLSDRDTVIHELQHADDDRKAASSGPVVLASKLDLELAGYVAGARYTLEEIRKLPAGKQRTEAIADVAAHWDTSQAVASVVASRTAPGSGPGKWTEVTATPLQSIVREIYTAAKGKGAFRSRSLDLDDLMKVKLDELVNLNLVGEIMSSGAISATDKTILDSFSGESILDMIERHPSQPKRP
jgi:hypothetical protein